MEKKGQWNTKTSTFSDEIIKKSAEISGRFELVIFYQEMAWENKMSCSYQWFASSEVNSQLMWLIEWY